MSPLLVSKSLITKVTTHDHGDHYHDYNIMKMINSVYYHSRLSFTETTYAEFLSDAEIKAWTGGRDSEFTFHYCKFNTQNPKRKRHDQTIHYLCKQKQLACISLKMFILLEKKVIRTDCDLSGGVEEEDNMVRD